MAIVTDRLNASKPPTPVPDPKSGKLAPGAINNNKDLDVEVKKEEPSFFGSFFSAAKNAPKKKGVAVMEAVSSPNYPTIVRRHTQLFPASSCYSTPNRPQ